MTIRCSVQTAALLIACGPGASRAQAPWSARLDINPFPSPYLSDWESNPTIGTLTITNPTAADQDVLLVYRVTDHAGRVVASGRSAALLVPRGPPTVLTDFVNLSGSSRHDQGLENQMRRSGRLPEGDQAACVTVTDEGGFVLAEDCATFTIVYPDPPYLIGPLDAQAVTSGSPIFQWTPLQVPIAFQVTYVLRLSEVLAGQTAAQALDANIPLFETTVLGASLEYPISAPPLAEGKTYAWRVQALDQNGYAPSANDGRSEIWTFRLGDPGGGGPVGGSTAYTMEVTNVHAASAPAAQDTLGWFRICSDWDATSVENAGSRFQLAFDSPIPLPATLRVQAKLDRYEVPGSRSRVWALWGSVGNLALMAYGDCNGPAGYVPWPQWLGIRTVSGAASTAFLMSGDTTHTDTTTTPGLEFGVVIVSAQELTVAAPAGFDVVQSFLRSHEIDVKPGINAFGVLQLKQQSFWKFFQMLGYDQKELELQGFVGFDYQGSIGLAGDSRKGSRPDVTTLTEFLNLRVALPERSPLLLHEFIKSMRLELELAVQDTVAHTRAETAHNQWHLLLNVNHRLALNDTLIKALRLNPGAELVSTTGLDLSTEGFKQGSTELKLVRRYSLDASWSLGDTKFVVGHPELEIGVLLAGESKGDVMLSLTGSAGWGDAEELGKVTVTLARSASVARSHEPTLGLDRMQSNVKRWQDRLDFTQGELDKATSHEDSLKLQGYITNYQHWIADEQEHIKSFESLNIVRKQRAKQDSVAAAQPKCFKLKGWYCSYRISLGNLTLVDLLALIRNIGCEVAH